jgi:UDP-N-acetylglucosamine--N-acetylmuramyl-(pentapeptide) pyrophosphoryl-undecaprenol N-acetylglucosamine transferase
MKICLTANSGGHLNQLLQLKSFYKNHDYFFVTDKNAFSQELAKKELVYFVEKFIFKEIISKFQFIKPVKNIFKSFVIFLKERPDIIITTGAGTAFGMWLFGKFFKKTIFIESIARTNAPSTFGKQIGFRSDKVFVQWRNMMQYYNDAVYAGIIFNFNDIDIKLKNSKIKNIFVTTGTYKLQFNRILTEIDILIENKKINCNVIAQIGSSTYKPKHYKFFDFCGQVELHKQIDNADLIICQGGSGSIMDSLLKGKRVIAVPRLMEFNEFFDNHQIQLVGELESSGLIMAVNDIYDLLNAIKNADKFKPKFNSMNQSKFGSLLEDTIKKLIV